LEKRPKVSSKATGEKGREAKSLPSMVHKGIIDTGLLLHPLAIDMIFSEISRVSPRVIYNPLPHRKCFLKKKTKYLVCTIFNLILVT
jgi:hypothetical protein